MISYHLKKYGWLLVLMLSMGVAQSQSLDALFESVITNNKQLMAEKERNNSGKLLAHTGIAPSNPQVEYGYFPGNSDAIGTKQVFGVSQSINFPTTYSYKSKIAKQTNHVLDENYRLVMQDVLFETWVAYVQAVYLNQYLEVLKGRMAKAEQMVSFYEKKQNNGDATQLEVNKSRLFLINIQNRERLTEGKIRQNAEEIRQLNGGGAYVILDNIFKTDSLAQWDQLLVGVDSMHPLIKQLEFQNNAAAFNHKLNRANGLPQLMVGYEREQILDDVYGGVRAGISIPLWQNKNQVKYAKANMNFAQAELENLRLKVETEYYQRYIETEVLLDNMTKLKTSLTEMNNEHLLSRSLELGQISIIEYFWEMDYFYLIEDNYLAIELSYQLALAKLYQFSL